MFAFSGFVSTSQHTRSRRALCWPNSPAIMRRATMARATLAALCVASAAAIQPTQDSLPARPSLRKKFDASPYLRGAIGGAAYGLAAAAISHPFDTIKTRLQTKAVVGGSASVLSRVLGLYSGVGPATAASILFRTVPFIGYEATRSLLRSHRLLVIGRHSNLGPTDRSADRLIPRSSRALSGEPAAAGRAARRRGRWRHARLRRDPSRAPEDPAAGGRGPRLGLAPVAWPAQHVPSWVAQVGISLRRACRACRAHSAWLQGLW